MSNMDKKAIKLCIFLIINCCYAVDLDYLTDNKHQTETKSDNEAKQALRIGDEVSLHVSTNVTFLNRTNNITENDLTYSEEDSEDDDYNTDKNIILNKPLLSVFNDYEYHYADDGNPPNTDTYADIDIITTSPKVTDNETINDEDISRLSHTNSSVFIQHSDLYNLEPAVNKIILDKQLIDDVNVWYVPERYPCWRLPLLFGRLKHRAMLSKVFLLTGGTLEDVRIEPVHEEDVTPRNYKRDYRSKWCEQGPCYGDHTLCIFPNDTTSKMCDSTYQVRTLSVQRQITVINTINRMRNRIAMGTAEVYSQLPTASNMQQIMYDLDLAMISSRWLRQCLPGPAPCSSLNNKQVTQLECRKSLQSCCVNSTDNKCVPPDECFVPALIGCLHLWFLSAGHHLQKRDVECGQITRNTMNTAQILWANTDKMGCAYGTNSNGDIRIVCNFSPGAKFYVTTKYYCGVIPHNDITGYYHEYLTEDITSLEFLETLGIYMNLTQILAPQQWRKTISVPHSPFKTPWGVNCLDERFVDQVFRAYEQDFDNGTIGAIARLVTKYTFFEESNARCDADEPIYMVGPPGSECEESGRVFKGLCYSYRDPYPGYRIAAIVAPIALFSLILYDLFSGVVRQTNC